MKRDPNLQDLSRDHHHALLLARRAERAAETGSDDEVASMWESIAHSFDSDLGPHFEVEEQQLLPLLEAAGEHELVGRTRSDHERLRALRAQAGDERPWIALNCAALPEDLLEAELFGIERLGLVRGVFTALMVLATAASPPLLGLALLEGELDAAATFERAELDESFQIEQWGEDEEAAERRAARRLEFMACCRFMALARG